MIIVSGISKHFNTGSADEIRALNRVSLELNNGEYTILLGSNGSGKSTLLNVLAGQLVPDEGNISIDGKDVTGLPEHLMSRWVSRVFQNPLAGTASSLTVLENFRIAALRTGSKSFKTGTGSGFRRLVQDKISTLGLGLENKVDVPIGTLSGGQRQSLTLLMSVMDETRLLLMDEPASALDPKTAEIVMQTANRIIRDNQITAVLITHRIRDAVQFGDRILMMSEGNIIRDIGNPEKSRMTAEEIFNWF